MGKPLQTATDPVGKLASAPRDPAAREPVLKLLVIDTHFTLEGIRQRQVEESVTCRDLDGFFEHVWSVHPFASLTTSDDWGPRFGVPQSHRIAPRHTFIEAKVGRFAWMQWLFPINFLLGQADLFVRMTRLIRSEGISVIRVCGPLYEGLFGLALARASGIPLVVRVGSNNDKYFETTGRPVEPRLMRSRKIEKLVERFVLSRADLVAGANQDNLDFALANGARPERATLFRYGNLIDSRHFVEPDLRRFDQSALDEFGVEHRKFLLYVGRLERIKQPDHVVEILAEVRRRGFDVKALLAGEGTMHEQLLRQAKRLGVADHLILAGNLGQDRLAQLYAAAGAVVSPHTGRALTEAALGEAPLVAYDVDWQAELVERGVTGMLVPHGDLSAMSDAVAAMLQEPLRAKALGQAVRKRVLEMLDPGALNEHERSEYRKLLRREQARE